MTVIGGFPKAEIVMTGSFVVRMRGAVLLMALALVPGKAAGQGPVDLQLSYRPVASPALRLVDGREPASPIVRDTIVSYRRQYLLGAAFGAVIGAAVGFVGGGDVNDRTRGEDALIGAAIGAGAGLVLGYFIKTPVIEQTALGDALPDTFALAGLTGGSGFQVGWSRDW